jgi:hypothetical protein
VLVLSSGEISDRECYCSRREAGAAALAPATSGTRMTCNAGPALVLARVRGERPIS